MESRSHNYLKSIKEAFSATKFQMLISLGIVLLLTVLLSVIFYIVEKIAQPDVYTGWGDAFVWAYTRYIEAGDGVFEGGPVTIVGKIIASLLGFIGLALVAIPAGLIGSGFTDAIEKEQREKELEEYRRRMRKSFRRTVNKTLRDHLDTLPDKGGEELKTLLFVPQRVPVARLQLRLGIDTKDIFDVCKKFPELRLKNLTESFSDEEFHEDRFIVEHFPLNNDESYGWKINRKSQVTIVSPSSSVDNGIGWFTYYLAKFGGFNYISKDVDVDPVETDSFLTLSDEPLYDKHPRSFYNKKKDKEIIKILDKKAAHRKAFFGDIRDIVTNEDSWIIIFAGYSKDSLNQKDFHFADTKRDGTDSTVKQQDVYTVLRQRLSELLHDEFNLESELQSQRYPLTKSKLGYRLQEQGIVANSFVLRPSDDVINFDNRKLLIAYRLASCISEMLDNGRGILPDDLVDLGNTGFGYSESSSLD